jgi:hypothetical protein
MAQLFPAEESTSEEAEQGTKLHAILATPAGIGKLSALDPDEADMVLACRDTLRKLLIAQESTYDEESERKLTLLDSKGEVVTFGTADYVAIGTNWCLVIDWKFGRLPVSTVSANIQAGMYGAMLEQEYKRPAKAYVFHARTNQLFEAEHLSPEEAVRIVRTLSGNKNPNLTLTPSDEACTYCPALRHCPAVRSLALELPTQTSTELLTNLGRVASLAKIAQKQAEKVLDHTKEVLMSGESVPGWKITTRTTYVLTQEKGKE